MPYTPIFLTVNEFQNTFYPKQRLRNIASNLIAYYNFEELDRETAIDNVLLRSIASAESAFLPVVLKFIERSLIPDIADISDTIKQIVADWSMWYILTFIGHAQSDDEKRSLMESIKMRIDNIEKGSITLEDGEEQITVIPTVATSHDESVGEIFTDKFDNYYKLT